MTPENEVYWLIRKEQHNNYPQSDLWVNDLYIIYENLSFTDNMEMILDTLHKNKPLNYVVVIDTKDPEERKLVHKSFISNNIIDISNGYDREKVKKQIEWIMSGFGLNKIPNENDIFFCSDLHLNHSAICRYCNRPWNSGKDDNGNLIVTDDDVERMNNDLISNWNSVVGKNSKVFFLGDFCLGKNQKEKIPEFVSKLNGKITLILGNHDRHDIKFYYDSGFYEVYKFPILWNNFFILSHAPVQWIRDGSVYANFHGHVHNQELYRHITSNTYNCCVEVNDYKPVSFAEIKKKMKEFNKELNESV